LEGSGRAPATVYGNALEIRSFFELIMDLAVLDELRSIQFP
jgi:hypothetical protein